MAADDQGFIYLLHWQNAAGRVEHYVGWTQDLQGRLRRHRTTGGCALTAKYRKMGLRPRLARLWKGDVLAEAYLQRALNYPGDCPVCNGTYEGLVSCEGEVKVALEIAHGT